VANGRRPVTAPPDRTLSETIELLQELIRNACVNDGSPGSGEEWRSADILHGYLEGGGLDLERYEPTPGRTSLVARLEGSDPHAPTLCLMGHTDVVPVSMAGWSRDPFGGELVDGEIWGRGAVDMLNLTASMAVALRHLASSGWRPRGTVIYLAVADEEAGGVHGAKWLLDHARDAISCDLVVTESGGWTVPGRRGSRVVVTVGEKGIAWRRLRVRGTPGHGSRPYGADNAVVKAAEVIHRISAYEPKARISESWRRYIDGLALAEEVREGLLDPSRFAETCAGLPDQRFASYAHACTHTTLSPNMVHGGTKTNVIPDEVVIELDARILPGDDVGSVDAILTEILGPLSAEVVVESISERGGSESPFDTALMDALRRVVHRVYPDAALLPRVTSGATDAAFFREMGAVAYGFGLLSRSITAEDFSARFHGNDERIDVESLRLTTEAWLALCEDVAG
jgi:acetylornithine deacetylase/succinyl-diaminopimelate desuccinylase-like protein